MKIILVSMIRSLIYFKIMVLMIKNKLTSAKIMNKKLQLSMMSRVIYWMVQIADGTLEGSDVTG